MGERHLLSDKMDDPSHTSARGTTAAGSRPPAEVPCLWRWTALAAVSLSLVLLSIVGLATLAADFEVNQVQANPTASPAWGLSRLEFARRLRPDRSESWRLAASLEASIDVGRARTLLLHAVHLDNNNWQNWQQLSLIDFQIGRTQDAAHDLTQAAQYSAGAEVHYEVANTAFVLGDEALFWQQMQMALRVAPAGQVPGMLRQIVRLQPNELERLVAILPAGRTDAAAAAIQFLVDDAGQAKFAEAIWQHMACPPLQMMDCQRAALTLVDGWLAAAQSAPEAAGLPSQSTAVQRATGTWNEAIRRGALQEARAVVGAVTDPGFRFSWRNSGFFWRAAGADVRRVADSSDANLVEVHLDGFEPGYALLFWQWIAVQPGRRYALSYSIQGENLHNPEGVQVEICLPDGQILTAVPAVPGESWSTTQGLLRVPAGEHLLRLNLVYRRPPGVALMQGVVRLRAIAMAAEGANP